MFSDPNTSFSSTAVSSPKGNPQGNEGGEPRPELPLGDVTGLGEGNRSTVPEENQVQVQEEPSHSQDVILGMQAALASLSRQMQTLVPPPPVTGFSAGAAPSRPFQSARTPRVPLSPPPPVRPRAVSPVPAADDDEEVITRWRPITSQRLINATTLLIDGYVYGPELVEIDGEATPPPNFVSGMHLSLRNFWWFAQPVTQRLFFNLGMPLRVSATSC